MYNSFQSVVGVGRVGVPHTADPPKSVVAAGRGGADEWRAPFPHLF